MAENRNVERVTKEITARPEVIWFAELMELVLSKNDHKFSWYNCNYTYLMGRLQEELEEIGVEINKRHQSEPDVIVRECVDVANIAMMIANNAEIGRF